MITPTFGAPPSVAADKAVAPLLLAVLLLLPSLLITPVLDGPTVVVSPSTVPLYKHMVSLTQYSYEIGHSLHKSNPSLRSVYCKFINN